MEPHLSDDQIDELLGLRSSGDKETRVGRGTQDDAQTHLNACQSCRSKVEAQETAMQRLALLKPTVPCAVGPRCPPDEVWIEIAAGTISPDSDRYLSHAADCDHCGPLLQQAVADFAEDLTPEEEVMIADLPSSTPEWQRTLAATLNKAASSESKKLPRKDQRPSWLTPLAWPGRLALTAAVAGLLAFGIWFAFQVENGQSAEKLLANAYAEKRTIEVRIEGAPYAPVRQERGGAADEGRMSRPALLKAEAEIAEHLKSNPENIVWLQASGRASLLEGGMAGTEQAVAVLGKAQELDPTDRSISVDLASAYILRGEIAGRPEDVGNAVELLGKVLSADPRNDTAQFNYAIALEKLNLKSQAVEAWQKFLQMHQASPWAEEARQRQKRLQEEIQDHGQRSSQRLKPIEQVAAAFEQRRESDVAAIDARIEEYQDAALQQWLPAYFDAQTPQGTSPKSLRAALFGLATLLKDRHGDGWLRDLLGADRASPATQEAVRSLAESERLIQTSDSEHAQAAAIRASLLFHRAQVWAGLLRARLDLTLIYQLQHDNRKCEASAHALTEERQASAYPWVQVQSRLEEAACASTSDRRAVLLSEAAMAIARQHRYPILALRAANFESGSYQALGDRHRAWVTSADALGQFWSGAFPQMRGYSLLANLHDLAEEQQQWFLETAVLKEAVPMLASDPDHAIKAFEEDRLGEAELRSEDVQGAESNFHSARQLFAKVPPGTRRDALSAETEVGLAQAELDSGQPGDAVRRLDRIRPSIAQIADDDLQLEFFQVSGIANLRSGRQQAARSDLNAAIQLAERGLRLVNTEADRWKWRRRNESTYRALVELELQSNPAEALRYWEWFKGATLLNPNRADTMLPVGWPASGATVGGAPVPAGMAPGVAYISYAMFRDKAAVWVSDRTHTRQIWISLPAPQLSLQIRRFVEHCSDPGSNPDLIRQEAAELYTRLLQPVEPWIAAHRILIIEPDGDLRLIPFEILIDTHGEYLGDRFAVTISPGIEYLQRSRKWTGITAASDVSILGNPAAPGWAPLPQAELEARAVAALFSHPRLMLDQTASDSSVIQQIDRSQLFHFSGHASATVQSAGLVIGGSGPLDALQVEDSSHARTQLVVLSACNSSLGSAGFFDDQDSFVRRLMGTRVPAVVASRWMVDSTATSALMKSFYAALLAGTPVSESLAAARRNVRSQPQFAHPFYWAGFSVFGQT